MQASQLDVAGLHAGLTRGAHPKAGLPVLPIAAKLCSRMAILPACEAGLQAAVCHRHQSVAQTFVAVRTSRSRGVRVWVCWTRLGMSFNG